MLNKFVLIALACVSVAQVRGDELENAINTALKQVDLLNQAGNVRYKEVVDMGNVQNEVITYKTFLLSEGAGTLKDNSTNTINNAATVAEEQARESNRPESVFQCIRKAQEKGNLDVDILTDKFLTQLDDMRVNEKKNIQTVLETGEELRNNLEVTARKASNEIKSCKTTQCVKDAMKTFDGVVGPYFDAMFRFVTMIVDSYQNFDNASRNNFDQFTRHISNIVSDATTAIQNCF